MCYANELSRPPISGLLELFSRMHQGERERSCSPPLSVFVCSLPAGRPESCGSTRLSIMRCFFYFYTAGVQLCTHDASPAGLLMDGIAWAPSATRWRWTLAFVNWGISRFRFCPLRLGRRVHQSGLTIGKCQHSVFEAVSRKLEGGGGRCLCRLLKIPLSAVFKGRRRKTTAAVVTANVASSSSSNRFSSLCLAAPRVQVWWPSTTRSSKQW